MFDQPCRTSLGLYNLGEMPVFTALFYTSNYVKVFPECKYLCRDDLNRCVCFASDDLSLIECRSGRFEPGVYVN
jgi:hypothetical protein